MLPLSHHWGSWPPQHHLESWQRVQMDYLLPTQWRPWPLPLSCASIYQENHAYCAMMGNFCPSLPTIKIWWNQVPLKRSRIKQICAYSGSVNIIFPYCAVAGAIYASIKSIGVEADEDVEVCFFKDVVDAGKVAVTQYVGGQPQKYFPANHFIAMNVTQQLHHWLHILARLNYLNTGDIDSI